MGEPQIDGLAQDHSNSIANALELVQFWREKMHIIHEIPFFTVRFWI